MFGNAGADKQTDQPTGGAAGAGSGEGRRNGTRDKKAQSGNRDRRSDSGDRQQYCADCSADRPADTRPVGRVRFGLHGKLFILGRVRHQYTDVVTRVTAFDNRVNCRFGGSSRLEKPAHKILRHSPLLQLY